LIALSNVTILRKAGRAGTLPAVRKTLLALFHMERTFIDDSIKVIVLHDLMKVDGHTSHAYRDKCPEHSWIIRNTIGDFDLPLRAGFADHLSLLHTAVPFLYSYAETTCKERSELYGDFGR
jgi:hypothetical protein